MHRYVLTAIVALLFCTYYLLPGREVGIASVAVDRCAAPTTLSRDTIARSRAYSGSGNAIQRLISKAASGKPITTVVLGGSVSACRGVDLADCWHSRVFDWINNTYPHAENKIVNLSRGGTGSKRWAYCWQSEAPKEVDLILLEFAVNDVYPMDKSVTDSYELLVRSIQKHPSRPAIVSMSMFSPHQADTSAFLDATEWHMPVAQYYDVPLLSMKNAFYAEMLRNPSFVDDNFLPDQHHIGTQGHIKAGELVSSYLAQEMCSPHSDDDIPLPPVTMSVVPARFDAFQEATPHCMYAGSASPLDIIENKGWEYYEWNAEKKYYIANEPGASITFRVNTTIGSIMLDVFKSKKYDLGNVKCMVDSNPKTTKDVPGYWTRPWNIGRSNELFHGLKAGSHNVTCQVSQKSSNPSGGTHFRILGIMSL